jgi:RecA/RadA recombinase
MSTPKFVTFETSSKSLNKLLTPKGATKEGLRSGQVVLFFARHKRAKSTVGLDIAFNALEKGATVAYIDADVNGIDPYRLNVLLKAREGRKNMPPALPEQVLNLPPQQLEEAFKKHLAAHKFILYVAKTVQQLEEFYKVLPNMPHVVVIDSITYHFRQITTTGDSYYGSAVETVEKVSTTAREYAK